MKQRRLDQIINQGQGENPALDLSKIIVSTVTVTQMQILLDMMGQQMNFDSDKLEDKDRDMGKEVSAFAGSFYFKKSRFFWSSSFFSNQ